MFLTADTIHIAIDLLVTLRKMMKLNQYEIAALMGVGQSPVGALEAAAGHNRQVTFEKLQAYAKALGFKVVVGIGLSDDDECP